MACCGQNRQRVSSGYTHAGKVSDKKSSASQEPKRYSVAFFEYTGNTRLTVIGPRTGKQYRFQRRGAVVAVDLKDSVSLASVPHLRKRKGP